jgi:hypothetical protein
VGRVGRRRFHDLNLWSEKKRQEKLDYMHGNPARTGVRQWCLLVTCHLAALSLSKGHGSCWPWSSFRFYYLGDESVFEVDRMP